jgi:hypothetical protein
MHSDDEPPVEIVQDLRDIAAAVIERFAPQIDGLPSGDELGTLVNRNTFVVYRMALDDPDLTGVDPIEWRRVVAARVGLALAFPEAAQHSGITDARDRERA